MTVFVNTTHPELRIFVPATGEYVSFIGGKLEIDEGEPGYEEAKAEAIRNPLISIIENETTCQFCGEVFHGKAAKLNLGAHKKAIHFDLWSKEKEIEHATLMSREIKSRAGFACDVCSPVQTFGTAEDLAAHTAFLHASAPSLDDEGNEVGDNEPDRRPGEVAPKAAPKAAPVPAATASRRSKK